MKLSDIKEMSNEQILASIYWIAVRSTKEANSRRGLSKQARKEETWLFEEAVKRFDLNKNEVWKELMK